MTAPLRRRVSIVNRRGLHARAAAKFARLARAFDAQVTVGRNGTEVCASSIMGLMMLAAAPGRELDIEVRGPAAEAAMTALCALVENKFDEDG